MLRNAENPLAALGVVIVAFNSDQLLRECLSGALQDPQVCEVVVVDNSSSRESERIVAEVALVDPRVRYLDPGSNLGFAKGCNAGAQVISGASYYFFVNPDVRLTRPLAPLVDSMEVHGAAIVTGQLDSPDHPFSSNVRPLVTWPRELLKAAVGSRAYMPRNLSNAMVGAGTRVAVGQVDGALLGIRVTDFHALRGFDERFELYYEDVDLCARARPLGGCLYVAERWGTHVGGASSASVSATAFMVSRISRVRYMRKHARFSMAATIGIGIMATAEFIFRTITRQSEGGPIRRQAISMQIAELRRPGSIRLLS